MHNAMGSAMGEQEEGNFGKYLSKFAHSHKRLRRLEAKPEDEQTKLPCHKCLQNKLIIRRNLLGPSSYPPPPTRDPTESREEEKKRKRRLPGLPLSHASAQLAAIRCQVSKINNIRKIQKLARMWHTHKESQGGAEGADRRRHFAKYARTKQTAK